MYEFTLPALGESSPEGTVSRWLKQIGEAVAVGEPIVEISTDKVDIEIPSPVAGVLVEIRAHEDETIAIGAPLAVIQDVTPAPAEVAEAVHLTPEITLPPVMLPPAEFSPVTVPPAALPTPEPSPEIIPQVPTPPPAPVFTVPPTPTPVPLPPPVPAQPTTLVTPAAGESTSGYVTPLVRKLADEYGVDLASVHGSGVGGRIRKQDILDAASGVQPASAVQPAVSPSPSSLAPPVPSTAFSDVPPPATPPLTELPPVAPVSAQQIITRIPTPPDVLRNEDERPDLATAPAVVPTPTSPATPIPPADATTTSASTTPATTDDELPDLPTPTGYPTPEPAPAQLIEPAPVQLTVTVDADFTRIIQSVSQSTASGVGTEQTNPLLPLSFIAEAVVEALRTYPALNATIDPASGAISYLEDTCLGVGVNTIARGVIPVIRDAADLSRIGLEKKIVDLATRAQNGELEEDEVIGGTFTLTNYGSTGMLFGTPSIQAPQAAILGIGAITRRPVVMNDLSLGEIVTVRDKAYLCLSYDPRAVTEPDAVGFLSLVKARIEKG